MQPFSASTVANCRLSLNTAWVVMHSPYLRHFREVADGARHSSAMDQRRRVSAPFCFQLST